MQGKESFVLRASGTTYVGVDGRPCERNGRADHCLRREFVSEEEHGRPDDDDALDHVAYACARKEVGG